MATTAPAGTGTAAVATARAGRLPPASFFVVSALFHYLGPSLAVLLFAHVAVLGVMWLRIVSAAVVFAAWRRPWRLIRHLDRRGLARLVAFGAVLAGMNSMFYLAVARLPLATVGAIEFLGTVALAATGAHTRRNAAALALTVTGVAALTAIRLTAQPLGFVFAFGNCAGFMLYVILGHRVASTSLPSPDTDGRSGGRTASGIDQLAAAMLIAAVLAAPAGFPGTAGQQTTTSPKPFARSRPRAASHQPRSPWPGCSAGKA
jgi:inner membrane transporter RhtA